MSFPKLEIEDVIDIKTLSAQELEKVPYDEKFWLCGIGNCIHRTAVRDYGIDPFYYWHPKKAWVNIVREFFYCGSCNKRYGKLIRSDQPIPERTFCMQPCTKNEISIMAEEKKNYSAVK